MANYQTCLASFGACATCESLHPKGVPGAGPEPDFPGGPGPTEPPSCPPLVCEPPGLPWWVWLVVGLGLGNMIAKQKKGA